MGVQEGPLTLCGLPEGAVALDVIEVCGFLSKSGRRRFAVRFSRDAPLSTLLGLLRLGEQKILRVAEDWEGDGPEGGT